MKKLVLLLCILLVAAMVMPVSALKFKDMSDNHWAAKSVYDLVNRGITQGFPDGTFRGNEKLTRYETAMFLSKMADSIEENFGKLGGSVAGESADLTGVKADVRALKAEVANLRRAKASAPAGTPGGLAISGSFMVDAKVAGLLGSATEKIASRAEVYDYRLQLAGSKDLGAGNTLKVGLDTMDYGWYGAALAPDFAKNLIDAAVNLKLDWSAAGFDSPMAVTLSVGPGPKAVSNAAVPADNGTIMDREYNEIAAASSIWGVGLKLAGIAVTSANTGATLNKNGQLGLGFNLGDGIPGFGGVKLGLGGEYMIAGAANETHIALDLAGTVGIPTIGLGIKVANSSAAGGSSNDKLLIAAGLGLNDVWNSGTVVGIQVARVGALYAVNAANLIDATGRDVFNRALTNDLMDIGGTITQSVSDTLKVKGLVDYRASADGTYSNKAQANMTLEGGIDYEIAPMASLNVAYRYFQRPTSVGVTTTTADFLKAGLTYTF
ncbi:MAG: S-layer homology domain-containing protein [Candidatus Saganbacteria bacterium]|nr:S-layer homology domain-containing protein [Candidatus Saganbacteria bacterium]